MTGYAKQRANWLDSPTTTTPILGTNLNALETAIFNLKYLSYNIEDYGAVGDGVTNSTSAIDAAWAAATATGGIVYVPTGSFLYSGTGLSHNPGTSLPIILRGDGPWASTIVFSAASNAQCIFMGSSASMGAAGTIGGGVEGLALSFPATKRGIEIKNRQFFNVEDLHIYGGSEAIRIDNARMGNISHIFADQWATNGINVLGDTYATNWYSDIQLNGVVSTSGWAFQYVLGAASGGGLYLRRVLVNAAGQGGFRFEYTGGGIVAGFSFLTDCVADGTFGNDAFLSKKVSDMYFIDCFAVNHGSGFAGYTFDGCKQCTMVGGNAFTDTGAGAADFSFKNSNDMITLTGVQSAGSQIGYKTDATTHTGITINNAATKAPTAVSDLTRFQSKTQARSLAYSSAGQNILNATWTAHSFDTNQFDFGPVHSTSTNPTRFTAPATGTYRASALFTFTTNTTGLRFVRVRKNGGAAIYATKTVAPLTGNSTSYDIDVTVDMVAGDYIEFEVHQTSTITLATIGGLDGSHGALEAIKVF